MSDKDVDREFDKLTKRDGGLPGKVAQWAVVIALVACLVLGVIALAKVVLG
jgi:hypothetical protein